MLYIEACTLCSLVVIQAFKRRWQYPQYVFIVYGWYREQWWYPVETDNITCNSSQMEQVIERSLIITQCPEILNRSEITDIGLVSSIEIAITG